MREFEYEGSEPSNKTDKESDSAAKKVSTSENDSVNDTKPQSTDEIVNNQILDEFTNRNDKTHKLKRSERISNARPGSISADLNQTKKKSSSNSSHQTDSITENITTKILMFREQLSRVSKNNEEKPSKKKKRKLPFRLTYKGWILVVSVIGFLCLGFYLFFSRPTPIDRLSLTYLDNLSKDSLGVELQSTFADTYQISDYTLYGETLSLYNSRYQNGIRDDLYGRNVLLRNIETGDQLTYTFAGAADSGIPLGELDAGVYEVYVYDGFTPKRVKMADEFHADPFTTIRRDKTVSTVNMDASKETLKKFGIETDENYLYLTVTSSLPKVKIIDVMIDPSGLLKYELSSMVEEGYISEGFNEAEQSYEFAKQIQLYLEEAGLRVEISRDKDEPVSYYGVNSRVGKGYTKQAKVFLGLGMDESDNPLPYILTSPFSNGFLANSISHCLMENGIELQYIPDAPDRLDYGVAYDTYQVSADYEVLPYTLYPQLRETGGKVTYAGLSAGTENNANFSTNPGMYGIEFLYASTDSPSSQAYFVQNRDLMAKSIAQGIIEYFNIPQTQESTEQ
ncbi:hypothetical protein [Ileibacterium valens]|uniref:hypothetical protein n=2 Tax=Ileibacterium valens TaxID=1862668 RepID=UPI0024B90BC7|nr:hypothetical protein [Ileibacterium valens]